MNILLVIIDVRVSNSLCLICLKRKGDANFNLRETKVLLEFIPIKASPSCSPHFYSLYLFSYMFRASILSRQFHTSRSVLRTGPLTPLTTEKLSSLRRSSKFKQASPYCSSDTLWHWLTRLLGTAWTTRHWLFPIGSSCQQSHSRHWKRSSKV